MSRPVSRQRVSRPDSMTPDRRGQRVGELGTGASLVALLGELDLPVAARCGIVPSTLNFLATWNRSVTVWLGATAAHRPADRPAPCPPSVSGPAGVAPSERSQALQGSVLVTGHGQNLGPCWIAQVSQQRHVEAVALLQAQFVQTYIRNDPLGVDLPLLGQLVLDDPLHSLGGDPQMSGHVLGRAAN